jgi:hypothetical protein
MRVFKCGKITIVCRSMSTRNGFKHVAELAGGDSATCHYLNRTWEAFEFQSVLSKLIEGTRYMTARQKTAFKKKFINR